MIKRFSALILTVLCLTYFSKAEESRILRFPNTSKTQVTFSHGGDIWVAPINGGLAHRLTTSEGIEMFPRFSPDGKTIAFSGEYDGNREVYTIPTDGGSPKRLTYSMDFAHLAERQGPDKIIMQWTADGKQVLYRSRSRSFNVLVGQLWKVDTAAGLPKEIPVPRGGFASFNDDGTKMAYNRIFREFRTWKRYSGGQADDIWIYDFKTKKIENITKDPHQDIIPMWRGNKVYFLSDRDFTMNLFVYDLSTKQTKKLTNFNVFDVKFPSLGPDHIAFENGGYIYLLDLATEQVKKLDIDIIDDGLGARPTLMNVSNRINEFGISPDGNRALFTARGDIYTVPREKGKIRNLTNSSGAHDRASTWSPDGKWVAFISDKSGKDEVYLVKPDGSDEAQLTNNADAYRYTVMWSPDSKKMIVTDNSRDFYWLDVATQKQTKIDHSPVFPITDFNWSPDSKWIAYTNFDSPQVTVIKIYNIETGKSQQVTSNMFSSSQPVFSPGGRFLLFVSDRHFMPTIGNLEYNFVYENTQNLFGITLQDSSLNPFGKFESDEQGSTEAEKTAAKEEKKEAKKAEKTGEEKDVNIDFAGIQNRIFEIPTPSGMYYNLTPISSHKLYYMRAEQGKKAKLYVIDLKEQKEKEVGDVNTYQVSGDEKSIIFQNGRDYYISKLDDRIDTKDGKLDLGNMETVVDKKAEWNQIFWEAWRQMKYFFNDKNMHGYDWDSLGQRYSEWVPYVEHRTDLTYIIGEMIGELDNSHAYVSGGDMPQVKEVPVGMLGAEFESDPSGAYKITTILLGQNWEESLRSPLREPGLKIKEGDYILAIDGVKLTKNMTPFKALYNKANEFVQLTVNDKPSMQGSRIVNVKTIDREQDLRYFDWVERNRLYVDSVSGGKLGYIAIPDMMPFNGLNWFAKYFYPQVRKEGLIIDDRYNGGGNVSPLITERLRRELVMVAVGRNQDQLMTKPDAIMNGPMVCLINEESMSDGDLFPYQFNQYKLGPIIGKRSWGGVIGIYGSLPFVDGSSLNKPEVANFSAKGDWVLEDVGMIPDIEVDNDPAMEYEGKDQQLDRAIKEVFDLMKTNKKLQIPTVPPYPDKKKDFK